MKLLVNLFGGPGTGKSTTAAGVFFHLKSNGVNSELLQEYAKDKTWQGDFFSLGVQPYIAAKQLYRQERVKNKVDVAITDGCLLNSLIYPCKYVDAAFTSWLINTHKTFPNLNIFIERNVDHHGYETSGRSQSLQQAIDVDIRTLALLNSLNEPYVKLKMSHNLVDEVLELIYTRL